MRRPLLLLLPCCPCCSCHYGAGADAGAGAGTLTSARADGSLLQEVNPREQILKALDELTSQRQQVKNP